MAVPDSEMEGQTRANLARMSQLIALRICSMEGAGCGLESDYVTTEQSWVVLAIIRRSMHSRPTAPTCSTIQQGDSTAHAAPSLLAPLPHQFTSARVINVIVAS